MDVATWIAVLGLGLPLYAYAGYPLLLFVLASLTQTARDIYYLVSRRDRRTSARRPRSVSIIIAAYNEQDVIARTLEHCIAVDYPRDLVEILVGSDGSDDDTAGVVERYADRGVRLLDFEARRGKLAVMNDCVAAARGDILVFTDANTLLMPDSVAMLVRHFDDPNVGAVCGELRLVGPDGSPADEGIYWRYEVVLKTLESRLNAVLGANGALYALRRDLFPQGAENLITEDFVIPMKVRAQRYRVVYDPEAAAVEEADTSPADEYRRRVRIGAGNVQALRHCASLLLPWKGFVSVAFWSHKVLRWYTPFLLAAGFCANMLLLSRPFWQVAFVLQLVFYGAAALGYALPRLGRRAGPCRLPFYFVSVNVALGVGLVRGLFGVQKAAWQKTGRGGVGEGDGP